MEGGAGFSVFDALRDTIYSEVATLIANNENRPHYLVSHMTCNRYDLAMLQPLLTRKLLVRS